MASAPKKSGTVLELFQWRTLSSELEGKIVTLDELKRMFPADASYSGVEVINESRTYAVYGRRRLLNSGNERLAYQCKMCGNMALGHPVVEEINPKAMAGRESCETYCHQCYAYLFEMGVKRS